MILGDKYGLKFTWRITDSVIWVVEPQVTVQLFNSRKWLTCKFSLQYPYIIQQTSDENNQAYQVEVVILI